MASQSSSDLGGRRFAVAGLTLLAGLSAVLAVANLFLVRGNAGLGAEVRARQQSIDQGVQLSPLNLQLSQLIGTLAQSSGDADLRAVLGRHGINLSAPQSPSAADESSADATPGEGR